MSKSKNGIAEYRSYYLPPDFPVLLLTGEHWKISDVPSGNLHFHNCLEIGICHSQSGYMEFAGSGEPLYFKAGDVTCVPRNMPHTTYSSPGTESRWSYLFVDPQELFRVTNIAPPGIVHSIDLSLFEYDSSHIFSHAEYPHVYELATAAVREIRDCKAHYKASAAGLLLALFIELQRASDYGGGNVSAGDDALKNSMTITPALDYIEANYAEQFDIDSLAEMCGLSPTHFRRLFHSVMGMSPLRFVNNVRIAKACNLLRSTEYSILNISEMTGFRSISSFNRQFMALMQTTPREYRNETLTEKDGHSMSIVEYTGWTAPEKPKKAKK